MHIVATKPEFLLTPRRCSLQRLQLICGGNAIVGLRSVRRLRPHSFGALAFSLGVRMLVLRQQLNQPKKRSRLTSFRIFRRH